MSKKIQKENIQSLDCESKKEEKEEKEEEYVYIKLKKNGELLKIKLKCVKLTKTIYELIVDLDQNDTYGKIESNPKVIDDDKITIDALRFCVDYINLHENKEESDAPKQPLKSEISTVMSDYSLFSSLYNADDSHEQKLEKLSTYVHAANYLGMVNLLYKLCAVIADIVKNDIIRTSN